MTRFFQSSRSIYILLLVHFVLWLCLSLILDVHPDMADHWQWSRHLSFGYYDHPPVVAFTMRMVTAVLGNTEFAMNFGAILFSTIILYLCYLVGRVYYDEKTALIFAVLLEGTPYFSAASVFWHIDQPFMVTWLLGLFTVGKYLKEKNDNWILIFGIVGGLGFLSKYVFILFFLSLFFWIIFTKEQRKLLLNWRTYAACIIAVIIFSPNLYWNYQRDWITFVHNLEKGEGASFGENLFPFLLGHIVLFSVIFSSSFWIQLFRRKLFSKEFTSSESFLLTTALVPAIFFTLSSLKGSRMDPHWLNVSYFSGFLLLANYISRVTILKHKKLFFGFTGLSYLINFVAVGIVLVVTFFPVLDTKAKNDPTTKFIGWRQTAQQIETVLKNNKVAMPLFVVTREYQLSGALALYLKTQPNPHSIEKKIRNVWSPVATVSKKGAVIVCPTHECVRTVQKIQRRFPKNQIRKLGAFKTMQQKKLLRDMQVHYLYPVK
ncbi:MAG: 4-amino-4-deoxy-L-arabinose transferase-like glycosyltransferase [bacterium]|jgi:4-amino-4-deoxy-L-arabinose transferase-like glycosyltransferase